jgi:hypothetical protein
LSDGEANQLAEVLLSGVDGAVSKGELGGEDAVEICDGLQGVDHDGGGVGSNEAGLTYAAISHFHGEMAGGKGIGLPFEAAADKSKDAGKNDEDCEGEDQFSAEGELALKGLDSPSSECTHDEDAA